MGGSTNSSSAGQANTWTGPVSKVSDGSRGWAVFTSRAITGRWISRSTAAPAPAVPVLRSAPSASARTPWKNDTDGPMSRGASPCFAAANVNSSRPAGLFE
ncbi:Uncharacterised protein [Mycobacteroides abscessus subsp. massiliense]|nr:Uncharacterised protein [Mycobacteroides abscessus subsp. massiliense]